MRSASLRPSVRQTMALQQRLLGGLPKKLRGLAGFGLQALVHTPFVSCNANARMATAQRQAAEMRMYRLLRNTHLAQLLRLQIQRRLPLSGSSILNVDFSNFGGVAVLVAALQTNKGRALPWALEALPSNIQGVPLHTLAYDRRKGGIPPVETEYRWRPMRHCLTAREAD